MSTPAPRKATRAFGQCCLFYLTMSFQTICTRLDYLNVCGPQPPSAALQNSVVQVLLPVLVLEPPFPIRDSGFSPRLRAELLIFRSRRFRAISAITAISPPPPPGFDPIRPQPTPHDPMLRDIGRGSQPIKHKTQRKSPLRPANLWSTARVCAF
jgi:hypothetical protein